MEPYILGNGQKHIVYQSIIDETKQQKSTAKSRCLEPVERCFKAQRISEPMKICLVVSLSFFFRFTASMAIQSLQSSLNKAEHLGVASLSVMYGTIIFFAPLAPALIRCIGTKNVLMTAWATYIIYIICNFYPTWATLIPSSALVGAVAGPLFTAQGILIASAGEDYARLFGKATEEALHGALSRFNGIFFMFYEAAGVSGNIISSSVLFADSQISKNKSADRTCGIYASESQHETTSNSSTLGSDESNQNVVHILLGLFLFFTFVALLLLLFCLPKQELVNDGLTDIQISSCLHSSLKMAVNTRMILLVPLFMAQGMVLGFLDGDYTRDFISCRIGVHWIGYIMATFRMFCAIFAISINCLAHYVGRFTLFLVAILTDTAALVAMLLWTPGQDDHIAVFFLIPAVSGLADGILLPQFNALLAQVFSKNKTPAFAIYHTARSASMSLTFALSTFLCLRYRLYIAISLYMLGLVGYVITEIRLRRQIDDGISQKLPREDDNQVDNERGG